MFSVVGFWQHQSMVFLNPVCDTRPPTVVQSQRGFPRAVAHENDGLLLTPVARKKRPAPSARAAIEIEPYSSAILRPLTAACVFRDCSRRSQAAASERHACRTLMRQAAIKWRRGLAMGDL